MMAGTISLAQDRRWSAGSWLFDWAVSFLAAHVTVPGLQAELEEIVGENLGWLGLGDFGPEAEREMRALIRTKLLPAAAQEFSPEMTDREGALGRLRDLAADV